jgi:hypothetical protein
MSQKVAPGDFSVRFFYTPGRNILPFIGVLTGFKENKQE